MQGVRGMTPLHEAVLGGSKDAVVFLCEVCGADISVESDDGLSPVQLAATATGVPESIRTYLQSAQQAVSAVL